MGKTCLSCGYMISSNSTEDYCADCVQGFNEGDKEEFKRQYDLTCEDTRNVIVYNGGGIENILKENVDKVIEDIKVAISEGTSEDSISTYPFDINSVRGVLLNFNGKGQKVIVEYEHKDVCDAPSWNNVVTLTLKFKDKKFESSTSHINGECGLNEEIVYPLTADEIINDYEGFIKEVTNL